METNKHAYYIIYRLEGDDIVNSYDSDNLRKIAKWLGVDYTNIAKYISKDASNVTSKLKQIYNNKYFIFKDYE